jgi:sugar/nucleoside kinase (ribokinase family)
MGKILVVGSLAYDSVKTPEGSVKGALGGSANYFGLSAQLFAPVQVVGVVGEDYLESDCSLLTSRGVDIEGIERVKGSTFHWEGEYGADLSEAKTLKTELNVFADFHPKLPPKYTSSEYVFLANIDPILQGEVLEQVKSPRLIAADTMNFWITSKLSDLKKILSKLDLLLINEGEAKLLTGMGNAVAAAEKITSLGPKSVIIKRGEYGFILYVEGQYFALPAYPIKKVVDPTGAGDTFAGGVIGYLAKNNLGVTLESLKAAAVHGTILASFTVQDFSVGALKTLTMKNVDERLASFRKIISF